MPQTIRSQLILLVFALAAPMAALLGYGLYYEWHASAARSKAALRPLATLLASTADRKIQSAMLNMQWLAKRPLVIEMDSKRCDPILKDVHALNPDFANIAYTDLSGHVVCSALQQAGGELADVSQTDWHRQVVATQQFFVGKPFVGPISKRWVTVLTTPVWNDRHEMVGSVNFPLDLMAFNPGVGPALLPQGSRYGFFDANGILVWRNEDPESVIGTRPESEAARRIVEVRDGEFESLAIDGVTRYFSVVPLPVSGWTAFVGLPIDAVYFEARQHFIVGACSGIFALLVLIGLALAQARRIEQPLHALAAAARTVGAGNLNVVAPVDGPAEIATVATEFNAMVNARRQALARLELLASVFTHARESIVITDASGIVLDVNQTFSQVTGYSREEVLGQTPSLLKSGRHGADFYAELWNALVEHGYWAGEIWNRRKSGELVAELGTISGVRGADGKLQNYVGLFSDITSIKNHQRELEHIAHHDGLTGLPNRLLLGDRLQHAIVQSQRRNQSLAVAFIDLDGFKAVNDQHGHAVGDQMLVALAQRMKEVLRDGDTLARIGGDEFVAVLVDLAHAKDGDPVLERLIKAAAEPVSVGGLQLSVSASVGVTVFPDDGADADRLLRHADQAMYHAKQSGKNRYQRFDSTLLQPPGA